VFNCSENVADFKMPTSFRWFAHADACGCFDEFNCINVEVLSAITEQFNCIRLHCAWT
jgi:hypothetical protein